MCGPPGILAGPCQVGVLSRAGDGDGRQGGARARLIARCEALPGAEAAHPFGEGTLVYKVGGKIFALISMGGPARVNLKVDPELARSLVRDYPGITPGYHMNKQHWVTVHLDSPLPADMVESMVEDSYDLVVSGLSPKVRAGLARAARGPTRGGGDRPPSARP
jgi:predicted DNA-binding protein (MmcQ/YjbR family)